MYALESYFWSQIFPYSVNFFFLFFMSQSQYFKYCNFLVVIISLSDTHSWTTSPPAYHLFWFRDILGIVQSLKDKVSSFKESAILAIEQDQGAFLTNKWGFQEIWNDQASHMIAALNFEGFVIGAALQVNACSKANSILAWVLCVKITLDLKYPINGNVLLTACRFASASLICLGLTGCWIDPFFSCCFFMVECWALNIAAYSLCLLTFLI